jgi:hypothetical protein
MAAIKPSRSDEIVSLQDQLEAAKQVEAFFEKNAPKRSQKPCRSEVDPEGPNMEDDAPIDTPEADKLRVLQGQPGSIIPDFFNVQGMDPESHEETEYYQDLVAAVKGAHHTIGTGFIALDAKPEAMHFTEKEILYRNSPSCNPATNDWIPYPAKSPIASDKPARSEAMAQ